MIPEINDIKKLSISDRVELAEAIWKSIDEETVFSEDQKAEIDRRIDLIDSRKTVFFTWEETLARVRKNK